MSGGSIGACVGDSDPLVVGGGLWLAFRCVRYELHAEHPWCSLHSDQLVTLLCR